MSAYKDRPQLGVLPIEVISIQSQVVYGYVGNNVATHVFQRAGRHVASVPTVILSNTPHYHSMHGGAICDQWFEGILEDLEARRVLTQAKAVLVGFLGGASQAAIIGVWLQKIATRFPDIKFYLDPVIGDYDCGPYVDPLLPQAYSDHLIAHATGLLPNQYELEQITGIALLTPDEIVRAARSLINEKTQWVVVTSADNKVVDNDRISFVVVTAEQALWHTHTRVNSYPKGVGDLFSASVVEQILAGATVFDAAVSAAASVEKILARTAQLGLEELDLVSLSFN